MARIHNRLFLWAMLLRILGFSELRVLKVAADLAKARAEETDNGGTSITLTNRPRGDGGGSQILYSAFALAVARGLGLPYEHRIFETVEHTVGEANTFRDRWNGLVDFQSAFALSPHKRTYSLGSRIHTLRAFLSLRRGFSITSSSFRYVINQNPDWLHSIRPQLREMYVRQANHTPAKRDSTVTFHLRRGDVTMTQNPGMYTSADQLLADISRIRSVPAYRELWAEIVIEENDPELEMKLPRKCRLVVIHQPFEAFDRLVEAEILVIDKSSFSYVAGLLSQNTVIYRDYWYPPMPDWLRLAYLKGPDL